MEAAKQFFVSGSRNQVLEEVVPGFCFSPGEIVSVGFKELVFRDRLARFSLG